MEQKYVKLTNTVYKLLEFFPELDPLKHRAKDRALAIMDGLVLLNENFSHASWTSLGDTFREKKIKAQVLEDIDILLGYLWIGKAQGWINSANCLILSNEYEKIKKEIQPNLSSTPIELTQPLIFAPKIKSMPAPVLDKLNERQKTIINFLKERGKAQVSDLQTVLADVTKRTIRRDLDELLKIGKIGRTGDFNEVSYHING